MASSGTMGLRSSRKHNVTARNSVRSFLPLPTSRPPSRKALTAIRYTSLMNTYANTRRLSANVLALLEEEAPTRGAMRLSWKLGTTCRHPG